MFVLKESVLALIFITLFSRRYKIGKLFSPSHLSSLDRAIGIALSFLASCGLFQPVSFFVQVRSLLLPFLVSVSIYRM